MDRIDALIFDPSPQSMNIPCFATSRAAEFNGLVGRGVFSIVTKGEADGHRLYGSRLVDLIMTEGKRMEFENSRFVLEACNDNGHGLLPHAPTVQR